MAEALMSDADSIPRRFEHAWAGPSPPRSATPDRLQGELRRRLGD